MEKFLQTNGGTQNREFLLVHHLQRANYIPALQLNHSMKVNLTVSMKVPSRGANLFYTLLVLILLHKNPALLGFFVVVQCLLEHDLKY